MARAVGLDVTLHRAFDMIADWRHAVDQAVALGIGRILTSGGARSAPEGLARLQEVVTYAAGRISIMPGAGINAQTVGPFLSLPITEVHASCAGPIAPDTAALGFGFVSPEAKRTDAARVAALKAALTATPRGANLG
jgi:copper homeostasis protein